MFAIRSPAAVAYGDRSLRVDLYGRAVTNDREISMARAIVGNRATSGSDQRPMYDQLLRPTTDRGDRSYDQS